MYLPGRVKECNVYVTPSNRIAASMRERNICINHNQQQPAIMDETRSKDTFRSVFTHLLCGMYGLVILVFAFVFPTSSVLTHTGPAGEEYFLEVFYIYLYAVSILFLISLHILLICDNPKNKKRILCGGCCCGSKSKQNYDLEDLDDEEHKSSLGNIKPESLSIAKRLAGFRDTSLTAALKDNVETPASDKYSNDLDAICNHPFIYNGTEGVNFYLRLGAIGFATGSMIHDGFKVAQTFELHGHNSHSCYGILYMVTSIAHMTFTFMQTFFVFKNHQIIINSYKSIIRLGLTHLIVTNIAVWCGTVIGEIAEDIKEVVSEVRHHSNLSSHEPHSENNCETETISLARNSAKFLFPCTIEYSLISAAVVYKIMLNVSSNPSRLYLQYNQRSASFPGCHKANRGVFMGLFVTILTVISIALFYVFQDDVEVDAFIFFTSEIFLLSLTSIITLIGFNRIHKLQFVGSATSVDSWLLLLSLFGVLVFHCFILVSSSASLKSNEVLDILAFVSALLAFTQASLQTVFILDGQGRRSDNHTHVMLKPGRTTVTFLLICNIALWLINTFEMERTDSFPINTNFYGVMPWSIVSHFCLPLLIFFRFHSSVCLSDIWIAAYEIKVE